MPSRVLRRAQHAPVNLVPSGAMIPQQYAIDVTLKRDEVPGFDAYPFNFAAVRNLDVLAVTFVVGENGSGKSTLLEAIAVACGFNPEGGTKNFHFGTRESHSPLHDYVRVAKGVRRPKDGSACY